MLVLLLLTYAARLYVSNGGESSVSVVDPDSRTVTATIPVSPNPTGIALSIDGRRLFVASAGRNVVDVVDRQTSKVVRSIPVGLKPSGLALTVTGRQLFVANQGGSTLDVIDTALLQKVREIEVGKAPVDVAITPDGTRAVALVTGALAVVNIRTGKVEFSIPTPGNPVAISFDADRHHIIRKIQVKLAASKGFVNVDYAGRKVIGKGDGSGLWAQHSEMVLSADGKQAFAAEADSILVIDPASAKETARVPVGKGPGRLALAE